MNMKDDLSFVFDGNKLATVPEYILRFFVVTISSMMERDHKRGVKILANLLQLPHSEQTFTLLEIWYETDFNQLVDYYNSIVECQCQKCTERRAVVTRLNAALEDSI